MPHYEVCAAVITRKTDDGTIEIFCAQRPGPKPGRTPNETNYKWEFPGGKMEAGETQQQTLAREIREEFATEVAVGKFITTVEHNYETFSITMHAYYCTVVSGTLELKEHLASRWVTPDKLSAIDWAAADVDIVKKVQS